MRHLVLAAAVLAAGFALTPAKAQNAPGNDLNGPVQVNGQCKQYASNTHEGAFFFWGACPKQAAAPVVHHAARRHHG